MSDTVKLLIMFFAILSGLVLGLAPITEKKIRGRGLMFIPVIVVIVLVLKN